MKAEVAILAHTREEALDLLKENERWNIGELRRIEPLVIPLDNPAVITSFVSFG